MNTPAILKWLGAFVVVIMASFITVWALQGDEATPPVPPIKTLPEVVHPATIPSDIFIAFGDSGSGNKNQYAVAQQMAKQYEKTPFSVALMLGDNIYERGDINKLGEERFVKPYKPLLEKKVKFVTALGNHDVLDGHERAQVQFFKMPGRYYTYRCSKNVEFFVLDTNTFSGSTAQQAWLKKSLAASTAPWKIVMGHHPVYTSGAHAGEGDLIRLKKTLEPILVEYKVPLYLAGHDHNYERFKPIEGVQHIVSGGAGAWLRDFKKPHPASLVREKRYHFMLFEAKADRLIFQAIDADGTVFDRGEILPAEDCLDLKLCNKPAA